nr:uncharacterized protein LOC109153907 isoform X5 [Ipomoea trifida]
MEDLREAARYYLEGASEEYKRRARRAMAAGESLEDFYVRETKRCIRRCDVCAKLLLGFYLCCTKCELYKGCYYNLCVKCFYGRTFQHNHDSFADNHSVLMMHNEGRGEPPCVIEKNKGKGKEDSNSNRHHSSSKHSRSHSSSSRHDSSSHFKSSRHDSSSRSKSACRDSRSRSKSSRHDSSNRSKSSRHDSSNRSKSTCRDSRSRSKSVCHDSRIRSKSSRHDSRSRSKLRHDSRIRSKSSRHDSRSRSKSSRHDSRSRSKSSRHDSRSRSKSSRHDSRSRSKSSRHESRSHSESSHHVSSSHSDLIPYFSSHHSNSIRHSAHYNAAPQKIRDSADKFFWSMVKQRGKTRVTMEDFVESMKEKSYPEYAHPELFQILVKDRNLGMDITESRTLYYIVLTGKPFCNWCNCFIPDLYFCCSKCSARSYALCLHCYSTKAYVNHRHYRDDDVFFLDYTVLHNTIKATPDTSEARGSGSSKAIVERNRGDKLVAGWNVCKAILNAGGTVLSIASTLGACTIM